MRLHASGVRDTARVLRISPDTVMKELSKTGRRFNRPRHAVVGGARGSHAASMDEHTPYRKPLLAARRGMGTAHDQAQSAPHPEPWHGPLAEALPPCFNADVALPRLLFLVSPTCTVCVAGALTAAQRSSLP